ncbi:hypothetical protein HDV00_010522 [Rhizophlyctis rosea]|nr:hypothetical protein HDV00_010522 [Rhizophlyctis rosea]
MPVPVHSHTFITSFPTPPSRTSPPSSPHNPLPHLPNETLHQIISNLPPSSKSLATCLRLDKRWGACAAPELYRSVNDWRALKTVARSTGVAPTGSGKEIVTFSYKAFVKELVVRAEREYRGVSDDVDWNHGGGGHGGGHYDHGALDDGEGWSGVLSEQGWGRVFQECSRLNGLSLFDFTPQTLHLPQSLPTLPLTTLTLSNLRISNLTPITSLLPSLQTLETLHITTPTLLEPHILTLLSHSPNLKHLHLGQPTTHTPKIPIGSSTLIAELATRCRNLTTLSLSNLHAFTSTALEALLTSPLAPRLTSLSLCSLPTVNTPTLLLLASNPCTNLTNLTLNDIPQITDQTLPPITHAHKSLKSLRISYVNVTSKGVGTALLDSKIETVEIYECAGIDRLDNILISSSPSPSPTTHPYLTRLTLSWCRYLDFDTINNPDVQCIAPRLQTLEVTRCGGVNLRDMEHIAGVCTGLKVVEWGGREDRWRGVVRRGEVVWREV